MTARPESLSRPTSAAARQFLLRVGVGWLAAVAVLLPLGGHVPAAAAAPAAFPAPAPSAVGGAYSPLPPTRIYDTRNGAGALQPGVTRTVQISGQGGVLAGATAVVLNVAVTNPTASSFLTVFPAGAPRSNASNLNWVAGQTVPNLVEVALSSGGQISLFSPFGMVDVVLDVQGYVGAAGSTGGLF